MRLKVKGAGLISGGIDSYVIVSDYISTIYTGYRVQVEGTRYRVQVQGTGYR